MDDPTISHVINRLQQGSYKLAFFQPNFLCEQISQICDCFDEPREMTVRLADEALNNLYVDLG